MPLFAPPSVKFVLGVICATQGAFRYAADNRSVQWYYLLNIDGKRDRATRIEQGVLYVERDTIHLAFNPTPAVYRVT
jgi:hypothetical protein